MGDPLTATAIASLMVSVGGTVANIRQQRTTRKRQKEQAAQVSAANAAEAARTRRQALREARVRRARLLAEAEAMGTEGSSSVVSGAARAGGTAAETSASVGRSLSTTNALSESSQAIADSQARSQLFSNITAIGSDVFSSVGGTEKIKGLFD